MNSKFLHAVSLYVSRMTKDVIKMTFSDEDNSDNDTAEEDLQDYLAEVKDRLGDEVSPPDRIFFYSQFITGDSVEATIEEVLGDDYFKEIVISVALFRNQDVLSVSADNVAIDGTSPGIHLNIFLTPSTSSDDKNLLDEIGNSIRHEFEHFLQEDYPNVLNYLDYHKIFCPVGRNPSAFFLYLVQPTEVSAHVRGYEHTSKNSDDFFKSIRALLNIYKQKDILTDVEVISVLMCWEDWFLRNTYLPLESVKGEENV
jgi:hypothetical protein